MDTALLCQWLDLPPGAWPPDDRTLLAVPAGPVDAAVVEAHALDRMERLRPHQLLHPELVTEGMNRLAMALVTITAAAPAAPVETAPAPPKRKKKRRRKRADPTSDPPSEPVVLDAEVLPAPPPGLHLAREPGFEVVPDEIPAVAPAPPHPPPGTAFDPRDRRKAYRELACLRRALRVWDAFRVTAAAPSEALLTPGRVLEFLTAVRDLNRERAAHGWPATAGASLRRVADSPLPLAVFRSLVRPQRAALAADWAHGRQELLDRADAVRQRLRSTRRRSRIGPEWRAAAAWCRANPEWLPAAVFALAVAAALIKTAARR